MQKIIKMIENASQIAILSHIDEDADALGSSLAMLKMLKDRGKNATFYVDKPVEKRLTFLSDDYVIYDNTPKSYDLVICLDCGDLGRLGKRAEILKNADKSICIDHHYTNVGYCDENLIDGNMSSTSEMIYNLFCEMNINITCEMAKFLYCGIMGDTGCLKYSCASPNTALVISKLMEYDFDHADVCRRIFDTDPIELVKLRGYIMNNLESYFDGKVTLAWADEEILDRFNVSERDTGNIVNIPRGVEGTQVAAFIKKTTEKTKISLRSNGKYNVGEIAQRLGGGGHEMAAGITVGTVSVNEAKEKLLEAIGEVIDG